MEDIEMTLYYPKTKEEIKLEIELEKFKHDFIKMTRTPMERLNRIGKDDDFLKEIFEGFATGILKVKNQSISEDALKKMAENMTRFAKNKAYESFVDDNGTKFLIEKTLGTKLKFKDISNVVENIIKPFIFHVN